MRKTITIVFFVATAAVLFVSLERGHGTSIDRRDAYFLSGIAGRTERFSGDCASSYRCGCGASSDNCIQSYEMGRHIRNMVVAESPTDRIAAFDAFVMAGQVNKYSQDWIQPPILTVRDGLEFNRLEFRALMTLGESSTELNSLPNRHPDTIYRILYQNEPLNIEIPPPFPTWSYFLNKMEYVYGLSGLIAFFCFLFVSLKNRFKMFCGFDFVAVLFFPFWLLNQVISMVFCAMVWILRFLAKKYPPAERKMETVSFGQPPFRAGEAEVLPDREPWKTALWRWICQRVAKRTVEGVVTKQCCQRFKITASI